MTKDATMTISLHVCHERKHCVTINILNAALSTQNVGNVNVLSIKLIEEIVICLCKTWLLWLLTSPSSCNVLFTDLKFQSYLEKVIFFDVMHIDIDLHVTY